MKSKHQPDPDPVDKSPVKDILIKHGASLHIKGSRGSSHKSIAEDLLAELETERHRGQIVQHNLNAILNQFQITSASLKNLQAGYDELSRKYQQKLLEAKNENGDSENSDNDTDTEGA